MAVCPSFSHEGLNKIVVLPLFKELLVDVGPVVKDDAFQFLLVLFDDWIL